MEYLAGFDKYNSAPTHLLSLLASHLELADLYIHGEGIEAHGTDEGDPAGWGEDDLLKGDSI